jgi:uncharacterized protein YaaR (DUF327 family)
MDIKINQLQQPAPVETQVQTNDADGSFRFTLLSNIQETELREGLTTMMEDIIQQGDKLGKKKDIRDMKHYRQLIKSFINEVTTHSHQFTRENFLDRKGRHRVYGMVKQIDQSLDELAEELMKDEQDHIAILSKIGEIKGLLLDLLT